MRLLETFRQAIVSHHLLDPGDRVLIALSAGPDSTCLLDLYQSITEEYNLELGIAHIDYHLRGEESDKEGRWIRDRAKELDLPLYQKDHPIVQKSHVQVEARRVRYQYFRQVFEEKGYNKLSTGHHLDDQIETFFLRLMRGTSLNGLVSMSYSSVMEGLRIIRPLLGVPKSELISYLDDKKIFYFIDRSNLQGKYKRNLVRNKLIPVMEEIFPNYRLTMDQVIDHLKEENQFIQNLTYRFIDSISIGTNGLERRIDKGRFNMQPLTLRKRAIVQMAKDLGDNWNYFSGDELGNIVDQIKYTNDSGSRVLFDKEDIRIILEYSWITVLLKRSDNIKPFLPTKLEMGKEYCLYDNPVDACWMLNVSFHEINPPERQGLLDSIKKDLFKLYLDHEKIDESLHIRCYRPGDRIELDKGLGHQTIKDILINSKIPERMRKHVILILDGEKIIGLISLPPYFYIRLSKEYYVSTQTNFIVTLLINQVSRQGFSDREGKHTFTSIYPNGLG